MDEFAEWTFEGSSEMRKVGTDGDHNRYLVAYMSVYEESGLMPILSGTADNRSSQMQETVSGAFFCFVGHTGLELYFLKSDLRSGPKKECTFILS